MTFSDLNGAVKKLKQERFYGSLELKFEAGKLVLIRKTETYRPTRPETHLPRNGGNRSEQFNR